MEKSGSDVILISDGFSEYVIDHDYSCYDSEFTEGLTIYIDTYYSPSYGDDIIIPGYTNTVCEVTDSDEVNIKQYYVDDVFDSEDKIIVSNNTNKYLVEYGIGCGLSMWRYEGKKIDIDIGGSFLDGIGDTIYLFDSGRDCRVWDADELSGSSSVGSYTPPSNLTKACPANSSLVGTSCSCNDGYSANGSSCITYAQSCQNKYGVNSYGDKSYCYCSSGYQWNSSKTNCIVSTPSCPINSSLSGNQCFCNTGYAWNDSQASCVMNLPTPVTPIQSIAPPVTIKAPVIPKPTPAPVIQVKPESPKIDKSNIKKEPVKEDILTTPTSEKISTPKEERKEEVRNEAKPNFFIKVFGLVKNFFWSIFK